MAVATVLAWVTADSVSAAALRMAVTVGREFDAYVEALHVRPDLESVIPVVSGDVSAKAFGGLLKEARAKSAERAEHAHRLFQDVVLDMSLPLTKVDAEPVTGKFSIAWHDTTGIAAREIVRHSRRFDLTVVARPDEDDAADSSAVLTAALFETGRPVLIAPPAPPATVGKRLMLAWNDTREAAAALSAAMPFAAKADQVTVVSVAEANSAADPSVIVRSLAHHGIEAEGEIFQRGNVGVGRRLLTAAKQRNCDLLAMGAYGHSRLRELVLGGATEHILQHVQVPLLMVH